MSVIQAIVLGIIQGLTEFLPVSSSGHLLLARWLFGMEPFGSAGIEKAFDVALHIGTFAGAAAYFWRDIGRLARAMFSSIRRRKVESQEERLVWFLVVASVPGAAFGALGEKLIEEKLSVAWLTGLMLVAFGVVLAAADRLGKKDRPFDEISLRDALVMGVSQALALVPGVSRSGVTMTAGLATGLDREAAARFSFLMLLPITAGAGLYKAASLSSTGLPEGAALPFLVGMLTSAVTGLLAVWGLLRFLKSRSFMPFVAYRVVVGLGVLGLIVAGVRPAA